MLFRLVAVFFLLTFSLFVLSEESSLWGLFTSEDRNEKFLPPDEAFQLDAIIEEKAVLIRWQIAEGYYLYKEKTAVRHVNFKRQNQDLDFPVSITHNDPEFGNVEIYRNSLVIKKPIVNFSNLPAELILEVDFQGCADAGLCYPPITKLLQVKTYSGSNPKPSKDAFGLNSLSLHSLILSFLGFGLLLSLTPCVFPMLPILSGILVGSRSKANSSKALYISSVYVTFMAITYSLLGVLVAILGRSLQVFLHHPLAIFFVVGIFFVMGFSMLGLFSFSTPKFLNDYVNKIAYTRSLNSIGGVASLGSLSALIATPCITPPLAAVLTFVAESGSPIKGALALFSLGIGMGIPLIFFGTSLGYLMPRSGQWMDHLKKLTGFILLGSGVWFASRLLSDLMIVISWMVLITLILAYLVQPFVDSIIFRGALKGKALLRVITLSILICGITALIVFSGYESRLGFYSSDNLRSPVEYKAVENLTDLNSELYKSAIQSRPVLLEFYADWCVECKRMESGPFMDAEVNQLLSNYTVVRVDITNNTKAHQEILDKFSLFGPPALIFFAKSQSVEIDRRIGFVDSKQLIETLRFVLAEES